MNITAEANNIIDLVRKETNEVMLFSSLGKDSLVLLDLISSKFDKVTCIFMYFVKDLDHIDKYINWAKTKYNNISFVQVPHFSLSRIKRTGLFCVPDPKVRLIKLKDIEQAMRLKYKCEYVFYGMKRSDSLNRNLMLKPSNGIINGAVYPLMNWTQKDILSYMKIHKLPQPIRYSKKASGGVGFNIDCYLWLREHYQNDLKKIISVFPMSERILFEYDKKQKDGIE